LSDAGRSKTSIGENQNFAVGLYPAIGMIEGQWPVDLDIRHRCQWNSALDTPALKKEIKGISSVSSISGAPFISTLERIAARQWELVSWL
jgi:hypothetical protein